MNRQKEKVPDLRFKGFTDDWEQWKLGDLAEIVRGASPRPISDPKWFDVNSDVGWLRISDVTSQNGRIHYLEQHISKLGQEKTRVITEPHLLLSIAATVGKPLINYVKTGVHDGFLIFLNPKFDLEFMYQWLEMFRPQWNKYGQPGSQVNLNSDLVKNQKIAIPSKEEQQKISSFFNEMDSLITLHQRKLVLLKQLKKGLLQKMFANKDSKRPILRFNGFTDDWEQRKLGELGKIITGNTPKTSQIENYDDNGIPWITPTDIYSNYTTNSSKHLSTIGKERARVVPANSLLITCIASIGKNTLILQESAFNQQINALVPHNNDSSFLLAESNKWSQIMTNLAGQTSMQIINKKAFSEILTEIPGLPEQKIIGSLFTKLNLLITLQQQKLAKYQALKKSLLQQMFI